MKAWQVVLFLLVTILASLLMTALSLWVAVKVLQWQNVL
jgi:hypothetical protein